MAGRPAGEAGGDHRGGLSWLNCSWIPLLATKLVPNPPRDSLPSLLSVPRQVEAIGDGVVTAFPFLPGATAVAAPSLVELQLNRTVRAARGRLSALRVFLCKSVFYGAFVWARRALNSQKRRFPARAVQEPAVADARGARVRGRPEPPPDGES